MKTLVISKKEIPLLLTLPDLISGIRDAYVSYSFKKVIQPQRVISQINDASIVVNLPGCLSDIPMFTVKVNVKVPGNVSIGLPFLRGSILLIDQNNGQLLALMDSGLITAMRTGAAGAIGVASLANLDSNRVALIGAGVQGEWQIRALHAIDRVSCVTIYDLINHKARELGDRLSTELKIPTYISYSIEEAIEPNELVILTTQSKVPLLTERNLKPGLHINAFGADQPGKVEVAAEVFNKSLVVVDDKKLAMVSGALNVAYESKQLIHENLLFEIGDVIANPFIGRSSNQQITIFGNIGLPFQDLVACSIIYKNALKNGMGSWIDLDSF